MITRTHNAYHLGDNLVHLNFMRKVALANPDRQFIHAAQWQYLSQLQDLVSDIPNLGLTDFNYMTPPDSIDAWRGANGFWYQSYLRYDFVRFHVEKWFPHLCERMRVENPIKCAQDMLFDYPAIRTQPRQPTGCDILVINSPPGSGQFSGYDQYQLAIVAGAMARNGQSVVVTDEFPKNLVSTHRLGYTVTEIGYLSLHCHTILMVSTGPSWPTFNIFNIETVKRRIILIDSERIWLSPNTFHCNSVEKASEILLDCGLL